MMKNQIVIILAILIMVFIGIGVFTLSKRSNESTMKKDTSETMMKNDRMEESMKKDSATMEKTDDKMMKDAMNDSRYREYSKTVLGETAMTRRVLFFYASWCPTCKPTDANLRENMSKIPTDTTVIRVNYNDPETDQEEKDLAKQYGITYQHTFVQIDSEGKEVTKWNGGQFDELITRIK